VASTPLVAGRVAGWSDSAEAVPTQYLAALRRAGTHPAAIGGTDAFALSEVDALLRPWAGLLLCGGADVDPACYGEAPHPSVYGVDRGRDELELALVRAALDRHLPVLAICRGIQVLNVALGGTLVQHLPDHGGLIAHGVPAGTPSRVTHPVEVTPGSRLSISLGEASRIDSCVSIHHQAIGRLAPGLVVTARSSDGLVEAAESASTAGWCVAVQWHPERSAAVDPAQQAIFDGFAEAARRYAATG
jgi:putative glutamine amidotransferase